MFPRWLNVRQVGECATRGYMCTRWGNVRQVGVCVPGRGEVGEQINILILVRSMYHSGYI